MSLAPWALFVHSVPTSSAQTVVDQSLGPQSWVRSICWLYEQIKEDTELLVFWAALTCSEGGPGSASAADLLDVQALGLTPQPGDSETLECGPASWVLTSPLDV